MKAVIRRYLDTTEMTPGNLYKNLGENMKLIVFMLELFFMFAIISGQEILPQKSCKISACNERDILNRMISLERKVNQQNLEIQQLKDNEKQFKTDMKIMNESWNRLDNKVQPTTPPPTVVHINPTVIPPSYTIPTTNSTGKEFFVMFPNNDSLYHQLLISSEKLGWAVIKIPYMGIEDNITVNHGSTYRNVSVTAGLGSAQVAQKKGIYVTSSVPITVYAMTVNGQSTPFVSPIYESRILGTEYISGTYDSKKLCILATRDFTTVSLKLKMESSENLVLNGILYKDGDTLNLTINNLSTFTLITYRGYAGTLIKSNYPIVVMDISYNDFKQLLPTRDWGNFFIVPKPSSNGYFPFYTPYNSFTNISQFDISRTYHTSSVISNPKSDYIQDFGLVTANDTIMFQMINGEKRFFIPPISLFAYNYSCPLPYFYRPFSPAYKNNVLILALSNNIEGIKVNNHVVTTNDVQKNVTTPNAYNVMQIVYNLQTAHHVHVISANVKVAVFIVGYFNSPTISHEYIYNCVS
ncbi:hypothetical protein KUTeg_013463 [Tegillarca granosa]|uniref:IgGFc-binding protein N-terminal domain-containing protein n=1 Tax=Tegillarca granosa TaxID=220873 RepID=A0ABQ9ETR5_TEGGR|nr:hypothetical protein KUTeg_013463 [Tegillarca granosa]